MSELLEYFHGALLSFLELVLNCFYDSEPFEAKQELRQRVT